MIEIFLFVTTLINIFTCPECIESLLLVLMMVMTIKSAIKLKGNYIIYSILLCITFLLVLFITYDNSAPTNRVIILTVKALCISATFFLGIQQSYYNKWVLIFNILPAIVLTIWNIVYMVSITPIDPSYKEYIPSANNLSDLYYFVIKSNSLIEFINETLSYHIVFLVQIIYTLIINIMLCMGIYFYINYFFIKKLN